MDTAIEQLDRHTISKLIKQCKNDTLPAQGALYVLECIMRKNEFGKQQLDFWNKNDPSVAVPFGIIKHILSTCDTVSSVEVKNAYLKCRTAFFKEYFPSTESQVCFLANAVFGSASDELSVTCTKLILELLQNREGEEEEEEEDISWAVELKADNVLVPAIVLALSSPDTMLRDSALSLIEWLVEREPTPEQNGYLQLLNELLSRKEEIITDHERGRRGLGLENGGNTERPLVEHDK